MNVSVKKNTLKFSFVVFVTISSINLWSFQAIDGDIYKKLDLVVIAGLMLIVISNSHILVRKGLIFKWYVHLFLWVPLLSVFGAYIYHDQPMNLTLGLLRGNFIWLLYFVLHIFNISKHQIIKLMIFVGAVWIFLTVVQQFTYPTYYFYSRDDEYKSIYRAGVYRYMLAGRQYGLFFLLFFFYKYLTTERLLYLLFVFAGLAGFYYYGTRQFAAAAIVCMGIAVLYLRGSAKWKNILFGVACILLILPFSNDLFGSYIEMTNNQLEYEDEDIRMLAANFYLNDYWPGWGAKILGNGVGHYDTDYGQEMLFITQVLHFHRSDVGIIGAFNQNGIFYVLNILAFNIKGIWMKFSNPNDKYLKLFFYSSVLTILLSQSYNSSGVMPLHCMILYLIDLSIKEQKEKNNSSAFDDDQTVNRYVPNTMKGSF